ncbi:MAG: hypothetical protein RJB38_1136 [Pseudomonadota bacterium]|jgi:hypothetical protein
MCAKRRLQPPTRDTELEMKQSRPLALSSEEWGQLVSLGVPLVLPLKSSIDPNQSLLQALLQRLSPEAIEDLMKSREGSALRSWLRALHDHYPQIWRRFAGHLDSWLCTQELSGAEIKLRRIALASLAGYL